MLQDLMNLKVTKRYAALFAVLITIGGYCVNNVWISYTRRIVLRKLRKCKQKQKMASKGKFGEELRNNNDQALCQIGMEKLIKFLREDKDNYKIVYKAFQSKALREDQRLNCVVEFLKLDVSEVNLDGPFAGLPVSFKDNICIKGYDSYVGCSTFLNKPKLKENAVLVSALQRLGAIPFVKSTVPQSMMTIMSSNPIDGATKNPQRMDFVPGGSSSGEGALIGSKASLLGFGSDIGGSVRVPAAFCGVVGLKPTVDRMSMTGGFTIGIQSMVRSVYGPICQDVQSCAFVMKTLFDSGCMSDLDPTVPRVPFRDHDFSKARLKIGFFMHDGSYHVMPAMRRAVEESVVRLQAEGHEVVPWQPSLCGRAWWSMYLRAVMTDGGDRLRTLLRDDKIDDSLDDRLFHIGLGSPFRRILASIQACLPDCLIDRDRKAFYRLCRERLSKADIDRLQADIDALRRSLIDSWSAAGLDCLLCPAGGFPGLPANQSAFFSPLTSYWLLWNLVNFPAGVVPVTHVQQQDIDQITDNPGLFRSSAVLSDVSRTQLASIGLSVSVQCVALPWREELCLNLMRRLHE